MTEAVVEETTETLTQPRTRREREIWEACDVLYVEVDELKKITGEKIMQQLLQLGYKKGCLNEIYKYRRSWWALRGFTEAEAKGIVNSSSSAQSLAQKTLSAPLEQAVGFIQQTIQEQADADIEKIKAEFEEKLAEQQAIYQHLEQRHQHLSDEHIKVMEAYDAEQESLNQQKTLNHTLSAQLESAAAENIKLTTENTMLSQQAKEQQESLQSQLHAQAAHFVKEQDIWKQTLEEQRLNFLLKLDQEQTQLKQYFQKLAQIEANYQNQIKELAVNHQSLQSQISQLDQDKKNLEHKLKLQLASQTEYRDMRLQFHLLAQSVLASNLKVNESA